MVKYGVGFASRNGPDGWREKKERLAIHLPANLINGVKNAIHWRPERRRHIRHPVECTLTLTIGQQKYVGKSVNLCLGGAEFTAERLPAAGSEGVLQLDLVEPSETIRAGVRIVRTYKQAVAAQFLKAPAALDRYIGWLVVKE